MEPDKAPVSVEECRLYGPVVAVGKFIFY